MQNEMTSPRHSITMTDCSKLTVSGVKEVVSFDENAVTLVTSCGVLTVEGDGLRIASLNPEKGLTDITGQISGMFYTKAKEKGNGFFRRGK